MEQSDLIPENITLAATSLPPPPPQAAQSDLIPENITLDTTSVAPGGSLSANWAILNQGSGAANSTSSTEVRITSSSTSYGDSSDNLASVSTSALTAGASQSESAMLTAPTTLGTYYIWVIADNLSNVTNQSNTPNDEQH